MKILTKFILTLVFYLISFNAIAEDNNELSSQHVELRQRKTGSTNIPRTPTIDYINCNYSIGYIELEIPYNIESIDVTIYSSNTLVWSGTINNEEYYAQIPVLYGCYEIVCITSNGDEYLGILHFAH